MHGNFHDDAWDCRVEPKVSVEDVIQRGLLGPVAVDVELKLCSRVFAVFASDAGSFDMAGVLHNFLQQFAFFLSEVVDLGSYVSQGSLGEDNKRDGCHLLLLFVPCGGSRLLSLLDELGLEVTSCLGCWRVVFGCCS